MIFPPHLQAGDTIGIVAPARKVNWTDLEFAIRWWEEKGFRVVLGKHLFAENHQYAGTDEERIEDLQNMLDNSNISPLGVKGFSIENMIFAFQEALKGMGVMIDGDKMGELVVDKIEKVVYA